MSQHAALPRQNFKMKIALDIGHVANSGSVGIGGMKEHAAAKTIVELLAPMLRHGGHEVDVYDFPTMGNDAELRAVADVINAPAGDPTVPDYELAISVHFDAADSPTPHGAHVCYTSTKGQRCARCVARYLAELLPGRADTVQYRPKLYILKHTIPVAILCECGFGTNPEDARIIREEPERIAKAICEGVMLWEPIWDEIRSAEAEAARRREELNKEK